MSTTSKKSTKGRPSPSSRKKESVPVQRVALAVTRRMAKPRAGFEALLEPFAALVEKFGDELGSGIDVELMRSSMKAYQALEKDHQAAVEQLASVDSTRLFNGSTSWEQMLIIYGRARQVARTNLSLQADIEPFEQFMRIGPRKQAKTATPPSAPVAAPTTTTP